MLVLVLVGKACMQVLFSPFCFCESLSPLCCPLVTQEGQRGRGAVLQHGDEKQQKQFAPGPPFSH